MAGESMNVPGDLKYSTEHEWLRLEGEVALVGITAYAQDQLGDVVYVDLPKAGTRVGFMEKLGEIESVKVASEIFSPATGEVIEANVRLESEPELVNSDPYGQGWLVRIRLTDGGGIDQLLDAQGYVDLIREEQGDAP